MTHEYSNRNNPLSLSWAQVLLSSRNLIRCPDAWTRRLDAISSFNPQTSRLLILDSSDCLCNFLRSAGLWYVGGVGIDVAQRGCLSVNTKLFPAHVLGTKLEIRLSRHFFKSEHSRISSFPCSRNSLQIVSSNVISPGPWLHGFLTIQSLEVTNNY